MSNCMHVCIVFQLKFPVFALVSLFTSVFSISSCSIVTVVPLITVSDNFSRLGLASVGGFFLENVSRFSGSSHDK